MNLHFVVSNCHYSTNLICSALIGNSGSSLASPTAFHLVLTANETNLTRLLRIYDNEVSALVRAKEGPGGKVVHPYIPLPLKALGNEHIKLFDARNWAHTPRLLSLAEISARRVLRRITTTLEHAVVITGAVMTKPLVEAVVDVLNSSSEDVEEKQTLATLLATKTDSKASVLYGIIPNSEYQRYTMLLENQGLAVCPRASCLRIFLASPEDSGLQVVREALLVPAALKGCGFFITGKATGAGCNYFHKVTDDYPVWTRPQVVEVYSQPGEKKPLLLSKMSDKFLDSALNAAVHAVLMGRLYCVATSTGVVPRNVQVTFICVQPGGEEALFGEKWWQVSSHAGEPEELPFSLLVADTQSEAYCPIGEVQTVIR